MNVIVHYPNSKEAMHELQERIANVHAKGVIQNILSLSCPKQQKIELAKEIKQSVQEWNK